MYYTPTIFFSKLLYAQLWYNRTEVYDALNSLLTTALHGTLSQLYKHDVVDVARQVLQNEIEYRYGEMIAAYQNNEVNHFVNASEDIIEALFDLDKLLGTDANFLLGKWLESAKNLSTNRAERQLFEINARNQITIWGPNGQIVDYAMKQWSGMVRDYCLPRWQLFFEDAEAALLSKKTFSISKWRRKVFQHIEHPFTVDSKVYPSRPIGDSIKVAKCIVDRWDPAIDVRRAPC